MPLRTLTAKNFFNRSNELEILKGVAAEALAGDATDIYLSGKSGVGKTEILKYLFNYLFWHHNDVIPFFYAINTSFSSVEEFADDYVRHFIVQSIAFHKKDPYFIDTGIYSLEDLMDIARDSDAQWAVNILDNYLKLKKGGEPINIFLYAISVPNRCYMNNGIPVVVMIDDFHKTKELYKISPEESRDIWTNFEKSIKSRFTPHIFTGFQAKLNKMFYEETSIGEHLELINLQGLNRNDSIKYFKSLSELYKIEIESALLEYIDIFDGTPFYIKSFVQAARQAGKSLSADDFWEVYFGEITRGKIYTYWTNRLKTHIPQFDLRKPSLNFLHHISGQDADIDFAVLPDSLSVERITFNHIINLLQISGTVEEGFSLLEINDDPILFDVLKGLYLREIKREPPEIIKDAVIEEKIRLLKKTVVPSFNMIIPSVPKAELVVVKSLQQIASHFNIRAEAAGQVQIALVELFRNIFQKNLSAEKYFKLTFKLKEQTFYVEITISQEGFTLSDDDIGFIGEYLDDIKVEKVVRGTKITLIKDLEGNTVPA